MTSFLHNYKLVFFLEFSSYFCAEGQHSQIFLIKDTWSIRQTTNSNLSPFQSYECLVLQRTWDLEKCVMENEKLGKWCSVLANCSQVCVYFFKLFQKIGSKIYQINKNRKWKIQKVKKYCYDVINQIFKFSLQFVWRHRWHHSLTDKFLDIIFLKTMVLKVTKILDPNHRNPIKST